MSVFNNQNGPRGGCTMLLVLPVIVLAVLLLGGCAQFQREMPFTLFQSAPVVSTSPVYVKAKPAVHRRRGIPAPAATVNESDDGCAGARTPSTPAVAPQPPSVPVVAPPKKRKGFFHRLFHRKD